ncbi:Putative Vacuolar protein sorting protein [Penicillium brasilianum]|uniref:Vacuolar protein-sorting-associated protein 36 n=1 Tax=Penicillium brasilianum TaxID=104259 RepID=A0A0F7TEU4_PENBI|nr:Putative Vacuolar protein sorting protein [Penicillium brasilianum]
MFFKSLDLTTALRPLLLPDETLLFVQDAVGLYEGKYKIPDYQNGHAYLTSHRVCYVAAEEPRKFSVGIDLKEVDRAEYQAGFFKSSPKITLYPKPQKGKTDKSRSATASPAVLQQSSLLPVHPSSPRPQSVVQQQAASTKPVNATWICPICSFSNPVPSNFDPATATAATHLPPCLACGIKPPFTTVLKAAISAATSRDSPLPSTAAFPTENTTAQKNSGLSGSSGLAGSVSCSRCTFVNHPSLMECEMCGAPLATTGLSIPGDVTSRADSPAPFFAQSRITNSEVTDSIKLSFRNGGEKTFHERLKGALIQRKWLLQNAPPVPPPSQAGASTSGPAILSLESPQPTTPRTTAVGIAGLEQRGLETRMNNQLVIGNAFEDLEALMASAKQIVALAETLARESGMTTNGGASAETNAVLSESAAALGMVTTKDMLSSGSENLYLSELSRNLAEYLTDDRKGILHREGGIMSLIDLWAVFNRSRNGVELVSPSDFQRAAELWEKLKLPVRLRRFKSGLLVVQRYDWSDEKTVRQLQEWMEELRRVPPDQSVPWDWSMFGRAVTAQEAAQRFRWSVGVAAEELEMAEDRGVLCREEGIEGLRFWSNHIVA